MKGFQFRRTQKHCHKKKFYSCGDLTIFPIREIRGTNRILYGCEHSWAGDWAGVEPVYTELLPRYEHLSSCTTSAAQRLGGDRGRQQASREIQRFWR